MQRTMAGCTLPPLAIVGKISLEMESMQAETCGHEIDRENRARERN